VKEAIDMTQRPNFISILSMSMLSVLLIGMINNQSDNADEAFTLSAPYYDNTSEALVVILSVKPGAEYVQDAQNAVSQALDALARTKASVSRKILRITPGHYIFSRPVIFKQRYRGIDIVGELKLSESLTRKKIAANSIYGELRRIRPNLPVIDGDGVTSFLVVDGVKARTHMATRVSGFYFTRQMAGLGGTYYPDFSYRLKDARFEQSGGYYSRYAFSDGGIVSVLGNASITLNNNIIDHPMAYQCGGVLRNEQYGVTVGKSASVISNNIVINPFAWHTGAFVDNNSGSSVRVSGNQILIDEQMPHEVGMIANFNGAFMIVKNNRFIDDRADKAVPAVGIRIMGHKGVVISTGNIFVGVSKPYNYIAKGVPAFPAFRNFYFLIKTGKARSLLKALLDPGAEQFVGPTNWPDDISRLVRAKDSDNGN
jgi:hypothetical protein